MTRDPFKDMKLLTDAVFQSRLAGLQSITAEENALRGGLARIAGRRGEATDDPATHLMMQTLGADILWQGWMDNQHRSLNMQLANVLARKEVLRHGLKTAFGRAQAAESLYAQNLAQRLKTARRRG